MAVEAGIVGDACGAAIIAPLDVAAERHRSARRYSAHDAPFDAAEMPLTCLPNRLSVAAEAIRPLQNRSYGAEAWYCLLKVNDLVGAQRGRQPARARVHNYALRNGVMSEHHTKEKAAQRRPDSAQVRDIRSPPSVSGRRGCPPGQHSCGTE